MCVFFFKNMFWKERGCVGLVGAFNMFSRVVRGW